MFKKTLSRAAFAGVSPAGLLGFASGCGSGLSLTLGVETGVGNVPG